MGLCNYKKNISKIRHKMSGSLEENELNSPRSHSEVFNVVSGSKRKQIVSTVMESGVSLGMVDPTTGRSLLYKLLTLVTNGDKIVLEKLDSSVTVTSENEDDDDFAVQIDHKYLVDEDPRNLILIKDLLNLPRKLTSNILSHPVVETFIQRRWNRTKNMFLLSFVLYLTFVLLFSVFLSMMYTRNNDEDNLIRIPVELPKTCDALIPKGTGGGKSKLQPRIGDFDGDPEIAAIDVSTQGAFEITSRGAAPKGKSKGRNDDKYELKLEVIREKKNKTKRTRAKMKEKLFIGCSHRKKYSDISLCTVEALLFIIILILIILEVWQAIALGKEYFLELENWFELLIIGLAISTLCLKSELDILAIVASVGICLAWIELIFLFGRYPSLGGCFSIMYYSITKRVVKTALGLVLLVWAFAFAFFIIHFDNTNESFDNVTKSFFKSFVMVLGEFEFDDLWNSSESASSGLSQAFTMMLLVALIILGTIIMVNLIVAIIITDIEWLNKVSKLQVLRNQAHHAVQIHALQSMFKCLSSKVQDRSLSRQLEMSVCVHRVCKCGKMRPSSDTRDKLMDIVNMRH